MNALRKDEILGPSGEITGENYDNDNMKYKHIILKELEEIFNSNPR
jgi:hypothetical protein